MPVLILSCDLAIFVALSVCLELRSESSFGRKKAVWKLCRDLWQKSVCLLSGTVLALDQA